MNQNQTRIGFIGAGNMATSLIGGLLASGHDPDCLAASDPSPDQRQAAQAHGVKVFEDNDALVRQADVVVVAVKPQILSVALESVATFDASQLLISIAAGVPIAKLGALTHPDQPIVRCMPNTPALLGLGVSALTANSAATSAHRALAEAVLQAAGKTLWVDTESAIDAVTAVSGSGPAYFFYLMEAMIDAGEELGLDRDAARLLTLETAFGAAAMARSGDPEPAILRANVTSPGGTTERALSILDEANANTIIRRALAGAAARSKELAEEVENS